MLNLGTRGRFIAASLAFLASVAVVGLSGAGAQPTTTPNINRGPSIPPTATAIRADASNRAVSFNCVGPLPVRVTSVSTSVPRQGVDIEATFTAAQSASDIRPGQCWRTAGWGNGALMETDNAGVFQYRSLLGNCPLIASTRMANGAVAEIISNDRINGQALLNAGIRGGRFSIEAKYAGRDMSTGSARGPSRYTPTVADGAMWKPAYCE